MSCGTQASGHNPADGLVRFGWEACAAQPPVKASMNKYMKFINETVAGEATTFQDESITGDSEQDVAHQGKVETNGDLAFNIDAENHALLMLAAIRAVTTTNPASGVYSHKIALGETTAAPETFAMEIFRDSPDGFAQIAKGGRVSQLVFTLTPNGLLSCTASMVFERHDYWDHPLGVVAAGRVFLQGLPAYAEWDKDVDGDLLVQVSSVAALPDTISVKVKRGKQFRLTGTATVSAGTGAVAGEFVGVGTLFTTECHPGDQFTINSESVVVASVEDDLNLTLVGDHTAGASGDVIDQEYGSNAVVVTIGTDATTGKPVQNALRFASDNRRVGDVALPVELHMEDGTGTLVSRSLTGTVDVSAGEGATAGEFVGTGTLFTTELTVGSQITVAAETHTVASIEDATNLTLEIDHVAGAVGAAATADTMWLFGRERATWTPSFADVPLFNEVFANVLIDGSAFKVNQFTLTYTIPTEPDINIGGKFADGVLQRGQRTVELSMDRRYVDDEMRKRIERAQSFMLRMDASSGVEFETGYFHELSLISPKMVPSGRPASIAGQDSYDENITATGHPDSTQPTFTKAMTILIQNSIADLTA